MQIATQQMNTKLREDEEKQIKIQEAIKKSKDNKNKNTNGN